MNPNNSTFSNQKIFYHLPGLFEFYDFYSIFLPLYFSSRDYFYSWADIGSIYGSPSDCIWSGGRIEYSTVNVNDVLALVSKYNISARLTFSNSLLKSNHLSDKCCNDLCQLFAGTKNPSGIIVHSDLLSNYLLENYPELYQISSTTKVLTDFNDLIKELNNESFKYVVPDFRLNKSFDKLSKLSQFQKDKVEFLCNECCSIGCNERTECYENVSKLNLGIDCPDHICSSIDAKEGYKFSKAMANPSFISIDDIQNKYMPMGFNNFKIEGRSLGSALLLEFILYYMTKPEYHIHVREALYLDNMLDLF